MSVTPIVIFGAGAGADTAYRHLRLDSAYDVRGFTVEEKYLTAPSLHGLPVVPFESVTARFPPASHGMLVALGFQRMNALREEKYLAARALGYRCVSYVSSRVFSLEPPVIGDNCFILDHQVLNLDVKIGNNVTMWSANHIGDRTVIDDHVWVSSHVTLAGDVHVGPGCFLGTNASVSNGVRLGARTFVGTGAVITKDTAENSVHLAPASRDVPLASEKFLAMLKIT